MLIAVSQMNLAMALAHCRVSEENFKELIFYFPADDLHLFFSSTFMTNE